MNASRKYYLKNLKRERLRRYEYWLSHKHEWGPRRRKWYLSVSGQFCHIRESAQRRKIQFNLTREWFVEWIEKQKKVCFYCKRLLVSRTWKQGTSPSIDRIDNALGYIPKNILLCCVGCNQVKGHNFSYKEMVEIGKAIKRIYGKRSKYGISRG